MFYDTPLAVHHIRRDSRTAHCRFLSSSECAAVQALLSGKWRRANAERTLVKATEVLYFVTPVAPQSQGGQRLPSVPGPPPAAGSEVLACAPARPRASDQIGAGARPVPSSTAEGPECCPGAQPEHVISHVWDAPPSFGRDLETPGLSALATGSRARASTAGGAGRASARAPTACHTTGTTMCGTLGVVCAAGRAPAGE